MLDMWNRLGVVCAVPSTGSNGPGVGDIVVLHHNVFRTYFDMKGNQRKSNEYFRDDYYLVSPDRIYMYNDGENWKCTEGYSLLVLLIIYSLAIYIGQKRRKKSMWDL